MIKREIALYLLVMQESEDKNMSENKTNLTNRFLRISDGDPIDIERQRKKLGGMIDWVKRAVEYSIFLENNSLRYKIKQGEVFEIDFGRNVGSELNERHYAVVMHHSDEEAQNIVVVPLTTKVHYSYGEAIDIGYLPDVETSDRSYARVSQIRTVDKARIYLRPIIHSCDNRPSTKILGPITKISTEQFKKIVEGLNHLVNNRF